MAPIKFSKVLLVTLILINLNQVMCRKGKKYPRKPLIENNVIEKQDGISFRMPVLLNHKVNSHNNKKLTHKASDVARSHRQTRVNVIPQETDCKSPAFREELKLLKENIKCKPRTIVIKLDSTTGSTLLPNTVLVKRCGGSCTATKKCIPTKTKDKTFHVREIKNNDVTCTSVVVAEDLECTCDCPQKASECDIKQIYEADTCRCKCNNENDRRKCYEKSKNNWYFNEKTCACTCKEKKVCTTGTEWNPKFCRCMVML